MMSRRAFIQTTGGVVAVAGTVGTLPETAQVVAAASQSLPAVPVQSCLQLYAEALTSFHRSSDLFHRCWSHPLRNELAAEEAAELPQNPILALEIFFTKAHAALTHAEEFVRGFSDSSSPQSELRRIEEAYAERVGRNGTKWSVALVRSLASVFRDRQLAKSGPLGVDKNSALTRIRNDYLAREQGTVDEITALLRRREISERAFQQIYGGVRTAGVFSSFYAGRHHPFTAIETAKSPLASLDQDGEHAPARVALALFDNLGIMLFNVGKRLGDDAQGQALAKMQELYATYPALNPHRFEILMMEISRRPEPETQSPAAERTPAGEYHEMVAGCYQRILASIRPAALSPAASNSAQTVGPEAKAQSSAPVAETALSRRDLFDLPNLVRAIVGLAQGPANEEPVARAVQPPVPGEIAEEGRAAAPLELEAPRAVPNFVVPAEREKVPVPTEGSRAGTEKGGQRGSL